MAVQAGRCGRADHLYGWLLPGLPASGVAKRAEPCVVRHAPRQVVTRRQLITPSRVRFRVDQGRTEDEIAETPLDCCSGERDAPYARHAAGGAAYGLRRKLGR